jgi:hypothetical protein
MSPTRLESDFQKKLKRDLYDMFPDCVIIKNNANRLQGIPDLLILWGPYWAVLECKRSAREVHQPNQDWYVEQWNAMSFAAFIYPENREEVLSALQSAFGVAR